MDLEAATETTTPAARIVPKVWGHEEWLVNQALEEIPEPSEAGERVVPRGYCLKRLVIQPRAQCSIHRHLVKDETFVVERGTVHFELDDAVIVLTAGEQIRIPTGSWHRFTNRDRDQAASILEVSTFHVDEDSYRRTESRLLNDRE
ncbi:MAG TPA: cupin domain-containing protein [Armatimonadota bacterium]|nr:cupin domain-containing protein [Armatimonadota bacterium]